MLPWLGSADPGRVHTEGRIARAALEEAREQVAAFLGTRPRQVVFTSGATEAINAAVFGAVTRWLDAGNRGPRIVLAGVEHSAVREASERHAELRWLRVDGVGQIVPEEVIEAVSEAPTALAHCQLANHEIGTVQRVAEVAAACREAGVLLHVDAAAGAGSLPIRFDELGADFLSVSAPKLGGPRGCGALLVRRGLRVPALIVGGMQERARRAGLEDVAAAVGFGATAAQLAGGALEDESARAAALLRKLRRTALSIDGVTPYGPDDESSRLPGLLCVGVAGVEAEPVLIGLDRAGVSAHSGSSCSSESLEPSPVLEAIGADADHSLRFTAGWSTSEEDVRLASDALPEVIAKLRALGAG